MKTVLIFTFLCALAGFLYAADNNLSYAPSGALEDRLREGIENTQQSIDFCAHGFAALDIENALEGTFARDGNKGKVFLVLFYTDKEEKIKQKN